jgi:hypothetical protein
MARNQVTRQDAAVAIMVVELSMHNSPLLGFQDTVHTAFASDPDAEFCLQEKQIVERLTELAGHIGHSSSWSRP